MVRRRLEGICAAGSLRLAALDIQVITEPTLRLDLEPVRRSLDETVAQLKPRLLVLDPFVRLHRVDENASGEVAPLLAYLRELQRRHAVAVLVVHHAKKGAGRVRAGQALRGSSEFHAWGDSNLYLRKQADDTLTLTVEHRAAPSMPALTLELAKHAHAVALNVVERPTSSNPRRASVDERIIAALTGIDQPLPFAELRALCRTRSATVYDRLDALVAIGCLVKSPDGYHLATTANPTDLLQANHDDVRPSPGKQHGDSP
jgi:AAA domain